MFFLDATLTVSLCENAPQTSLTLDFIRCFAAKTILPIFISLITRMRYKRDIKMGRLYTPGGAVIGIVGGGVTFRFF